MKMMAEMPLHLNHQKEWCSGNPDKKLKRPARSSEPSQSTRLVPSSSSAPTFASTIKLLLSPDRSQYYQAFGFQGPCHFKSWWFGFMFVQVPLLTKRALESSVVANLADAPIWLMRWSYWCADPPDFAYALNLLILLMYWCTDAADALMLLNQDQDLLPDLSIAVCSSFGTPCLRLP